MAVSGDTTFNLVGNDLVQEAYQLCGLDSEGEAITAKMYTDGRRSLNLILKDWGAKERLWLRTEATPLTLVTDTASYALTPDSQKPLRILSVRRRNSDSIDTPMRMLSRQEYFDLPNKTTAGPPVCWYYDPQTTAGTLYVWPRPAAADATEYTLPYTYLRRMDDIDSSSNDADIPQEWLRALAYTLATELALKNGIAGDLRAEISARAASHVADIEGWDNETAAIFLMPDDRMC